MSWLAGWLFVDFQPLDLVKTISGSLSDLGELALYTGIFSILSECLIVAIFNP
jgi:hypothetical protein